jgi:hypothetical protein
MSKNTSYTAKLHGGATELREECVELSVKLRASLCNSVVQFPFVRTTTTFE